MSLVATHTPHHNSGAVLGATQLAVDIIKQSRLTLPSCHASCSKESSNAIARPAATSRVSSATRNREPSVPTRGKCNRSFLLVGP